MFSPCSAKRRASDKDLPVQSKHVRPNAIFIARKKSFTIPMQVQLIHFLMLSQLGDFPCSKFVVSRYKI